MSDRNTTTTTPQAETRSAFDSAMANVPWYAGLTAEQSEAVYGDYLHFAGMNPDTEQSVIMADYAESAAEWGSYAELASDWESVGEENEPIGHEEPVVDTAALKAAAEEQEQREREEAEELAKAAVKVIRKAERALLRGHIEGGRLADEYLHCRMRIRGGKGARAERAAGVTRLEGELSKWTSGVDVNRTIATYHTWRLLVAEDMTKRAESLPMTHFRDGWCRLVERTAKDTAEETWVLLAGLEEDCRTAFATAIAEEWSLATVHGAVKELTARYAAMQEAAKRTAAEAARAEAEAAEADRKAKGEETAEAAKAAKAAVEAAEKAKGEEKARLTEAAEKAKAELIAKQKAQAEAVAAELNRKAEAARKEALAKEAAKAAEKAQQAAKTAEERKVEADKAKAERDAKRAMEEAEAACRQPVVKLGDIGKAGAAKDVAMMALELVEGNDEPDTASEHLSAMLAVSKHTSRRVQLAMSVAGALMAGKQVDVAGALLLLHASKLVSKDDKRAVNAALVQMNRDDRKALDATQFDGAESVNGEPVAAA